MKVLFINSVCGFGSTGRIVVNLAKSVEESLVCYGRMNYPSDEVPSYKMTNLFGNAVAAFGTIAGNHHGFQNAKETRKLIQKIQEFSPDVIHLHNLHGYYLHVGILFHYLKESGIPVVWTLHDCWSFTGYCPNYDYIGCRQFESCCQKCPQPWNYPFSLFKQHVRKNFLEKKALFSNVEKLVFVTPSEWLKNELSKSFLKNCPALVIHNGIDTSLFSPRAAEKDAHFSLLFVSNIWIKEKGADDMHRLFAQLDPTIRIKVIGKNSSQFAKYPQCRCIEQTNNIRELAEHYASAHLFVNMTLQENFPTVHLEALACGTPILTYHSGGSPEALCKDCGNSVQRGDVEGMRTQILAVKQNNPFSNECCVHHASQFTNTAMCRNYLDLYERITHERT